MDRFDSLTRLIKLAAGEMADPGLQAMADAGDIAKGPAGMPGIKMHPEKADGKDESKEVMRVAHELDAKSKEIAGLRQQLQEAKMDAQRVQVKAEITNEQTKMREGLRQEQQRMLDGIRKEQERMYAQIRAEQKELDKKQSELRIAEAQQKGEITAAKAEYEAGHTAAQAQYEAQFTAAEAQNRANMAIAQAQHQAQLDKDVSAHDAQIAQSKADSLMDIAQQTTDMYIKQTEKARADADKYFTTQQQQYSASHPVISPALQNRLDGAMKSIGRIGKSLNTMTGMGKLARAMRDLEKVAMLTHDASDMPEEKELSDEELRRIKLQESVDRMLKDYYPADTDFRAEYYGKTPLATRAAALARMVDLRYMMMQQARKGNKDVIEALPYLERQIERYREQAARYNEYINSEGERGKHGDEINDYIDLVRGKRWNGNNEDVYPFKRGQWDYEDVGYWGYNSPFYQLANASKLYDEAETAPWYKNVGEYFNLPRHWMHNMHKRELMRNYYDRRRGNHTLDFEGAANNISYYNPALMWNNDFPSVGKTPEEVNRNKDVMSRANYLYDSYTPEGATTQMIGNALGDLLNFSFGKTLVTAPFRGVAGVAMKKGIPAAMKTMGRNVVQPWRYVAAGKGALSKGWRGANLSMAGMLAYDMADKSQFNSPYMNSEGVTYMNTGTPQVWNENEPVYEEVGEEGERLVPFRYKSQSEYEQEQKSMGR